MVKSLYSNFRIVTAMFSDVRIFRNFTVCLKFCCNSVLEASLCFHWLKKRMQSCSCGPGIYLRSRWWAPPAIVTTLMSGLGLFDTCNRVDHSLTAVSKYSPSNIHCYMSHIMRKPVHAIWEQQRRRSACAFAQSDQRLAVWSVPLLFAAWIV